MPTLSNAHPVAADVPADGLSRGLPWGIVALSTSFALYWLSNVLLWYPWSVSEALGVALMLSVSPLMWAAGIVFVLTRWGRSSLWAGAAATAAVMVGVSVCADLVFFGVVRGAIEELLRPTTYAGYGWVAVLPFLIVILGGRRLDGRRRAPTARAAVLPFTVGAAALLLLSLIILMTGG